MLRATQERLHEHPFAPGLDTTPLLAGLRRIYRQGRAGHRRVLDAPTTENLHAWRKRVKDLRYGSELLGDADAKRLRQVRRRARTLSELLGDDHDLAVLAEMAGDCPSILAAIENDRARLQSKARKLGKKLYARPPRRFVRRAQRRARSASA
jgi:CHAD domain-containing protein